MDDKALLIQGITLAYYESLIENNKDKSTELLNRINQEVKPPEIIFGMVGDAQIINSLKNLLSCMMDPSNIITDKGILLQNIRIACGDDDRLYDSFKLAIPNEIDDIKCKKTIIEYRRRLNNHFKEKKIEELMTKIPSKFKFERDKITDVGRFIIEYIEELEKVATISEGEKDEAILTSIDFGKPDEIGDLYEKDKVNGEGEFIYRTGKKAINRMLQGGIRPGNFVLINALQHKNKTGFTLDLFREIATLNKPRIKDPNKKPLLLWISFEDKTQKNLRTLYTSQKYNETLEYIKIDPHLTKEDFIKGFLPQMTATGFHIKMYRINPTDWTFHALFGLIMKLETEGYALEGLFCDYLGMLPTIGCNKNGPTGTDMRELFRRVRNFCESRNAFFVTPHQLSSDAKALIRVDIPEAEFVKIIAEKGYTSGSKQLDQEVDIELYIHLFKYKGNTIFSIMRGKHRVDSILENDDWKYCLYKFPYLMPIPADEDTEHDYSFARLSKINGQAREEAESDFFEL